MPRLLAQTEMSTQRSIPHVYEGTASSKPSQQADAGTCPANLTAPNMAKRCSSASCYRYAAQRPRTARTSAGANDKTAMCRTPLQHKLSHDESRLGVIHVASAAHKNACNVVQVNPVSSEKLHRKHRRNLSVSDGSSRGLPRASLAR